MDNVDEIMSFLFEILIANCDKFMVFSFGYLISLILDLNLLQNCCHQSGRQMDRLHHNQGLPF